MREFKKEKILPKQEEINSIFYDSSYLGPGFFIINRDQKGFIKVYTTNEEGFPCYAIRAYIEGSTENPDEDFSTMSFTFSKSEEKSLYEMFKSLSTSLCGKKIYTIDQKAQGKNNIQITSNIKETTITFSKDTYHGTQHPSNFIDILLGDDYTCNYYNEIASMYQSLKENCKQELSSKEIERLFINNKKGGLSMEKKELNYPIKYAVLELKERGGWVDGYQETTCGFIVSKCYVISSTTEYLSNGETKSSHNVVFPYNSYEMYKRILFDRREIIGDRIVPKYNASDQIYPCTKVSSLFDDYETTKTQADEMNEELHSKLGLDLSLLDSDWKEKYAQLEKRFDFEMYMCNRYGELVEEATKDMVITKNLPQPIKKK